MMCSQDRTRLSVLLLLSIAISAQAETYKYRDQYGVTHYVDHISRVPAQYRDQLEQLQLRKDHLSASERSALKAQQELQRQQMIKSLNTDNFETRVQIVGDQVLVPVTLGYGGREVSTSLLLDTGASTLFLDSQLRSRLGMRGLQQADAEVAGGKLIKIDIGTLDYVRIGPAKINRISAAFSQSRSGNSAHIGLLGMNVLRNFEYSIDYDQQRIRWKSK